MNKQQATDYIIEQLQSGVGEQEIIHALSQQLKASPQIVSKFVAQVVEDQKLLQPVSAPPVSGPPVSGPPAPVESAQVVLPPWLQPEVSGGHAAASSSSFSFAPAGVRSAPAAPRVAPAVRAATAAAPEKAQFAAQVELSPQDQAELEDLVLKALLKKRKQSDIIMAVCERSGIDWDHAQRLVAQVSSRNRKKLVSGQNMIIIPICIIAILAGLALVGAGAVESFTLYKAFADPLTVTTTSDPREIIWGFIAGSVLVLGGGFGLIRALQEQFDE